MLKEITVLFVLFSIPLLITVVNPVAAQTPAVTEINQNVAREENTGFNWWWLLPLILLPIPLILMSREAAEDDEENYDRAVSRSGFEKNALNAAYFSEIKRPSKNKKSNSHANNAAKSSRSKTTK